MLKQISTNDYVMFRLTEYGKKLLQNDEHFVIFSNKIGKDYQMQIHQFARIIGPHLVNGYESVIENNQLFIDDDIIEDRDIE
jgi:hypothetical protein